MKANRHTWSIGESLKYRIDLAAMAAMEFLAAMRAYP